MSVVCDPSRLTGTRCCFFKQKTAYEMRISDWSSDVCSSDLVLPALPVRAWSVLRSWTKLRPVRQHAQLCFQAGQRPGQSLPRSDEHTSELQSLMRISSAVFCLKKKTICTEKQLHFTLKYTLAYITLITQYQTIQRQLDL